MEKCYVTSTRNTHQNRKDEIIGTCGPCSFINLFGLKGNFNFEKELAEMGRLKPFHASNFSSFLIWAEYLKKDVTVYTSGLSISDKMFDMMYRYENTKEKNKKKFRQECLRRVNMILLKNEINIKIYKKDYLGLINFLLLKNKIVIFSMADDFFHDGNLISHYRVCYGKDGDDYLIKDSGFGDVEGILRISEKDMRKHLDNAKKVTGVNEIVCIR